MENKTYPPARYTKKAPGHQDTSIVMSDTLYYPTNEVFGPRNKLIEVPLIEVPSKTVGLPASRNGRSGGCDNISQHHPLRLPLMFDCNNLSFLYLKTTTGNQCTQAVTGE